MVAMSNITFQISHVSLLWTLLVWVRWTPRTLETATARPGSRTRLDWRFRAISWVAKRKNMENLGISRYQWLPGPDDSLPCLASVLGACHLKLRTLAKPSMALKEAVQAKHVQAKVPGHSSAPGQAARTYGSRKSEPKGHVICRVAVGRDCGGYACSVPLLGPFG